MLEPHDFSRRRLSEDMNFNEIRLADDLNNKFIKEIRKLFSPPWPIMVYVIAPII